jgi:hypothetical protein
MALKDVPRQVIMDLTQSADMLESGQAHWGVGNVSHHRFKSDRQSGTR